MQPTNTSLELPLSDDPLSSFTIPARWYLDEEIYAQEKNAIFYREWHYNGHVSTLTTPGDYVTMQLADENIFVIRDDDDQLRGFYNVCRHRAHQLHGTLLGPPRVVLETLHQRGQPFLAVNHVRVDALPFLGHLVVLCFWG